MHRLIRCLLLAAALWPAASPGENLYAASVRIPVGESANRLGGNLYVVDAATGASKLIGAIRVGGVTPIGVTGIADHPKTGTLYGITAKSSPNLPRSLVKLDAASAEATVVGPLGATGSDIAFDRDGTLFVWLRETSQLGTIDLATGNATAMGAPGPTSETGGLAIDARGRGYLATTGATGSIDHIDIRTGTITRGPALHGAPHPAGINSLAVSSEGVLFAVNTDLGSPADTRLVKINIATGKVTPVGSLPNNTDALMFAPGAGGFRAILLSRWGALIVAALVVLTLVVVVFVGKRRRA